MSRKLTPKDLAYEAIADDWATYISDFDTARRIRMLVHTLLGGASVRGQRVLEVGCGLGYFTRELLLYEPAALTAVDISPALVEKLAASSPGAECLVADALDLDMALQDRKFDIILSSEVIEHTPDPRQAFSQMAKHLAPGGRLVVSVPNRRWKWLLSVVQMLGLRKGYQGFENWVGPADLLEWARETGLIALKTTGIHSLPWHLSQRLVVAMDNWFGSRNYGFAVNLAILAQKPVVAVLAGKESANSNVAPGKRAMPSLLLFCLALSSAGFIAFGLSGCGTPSIGAIKENPKDHLRYVWLPGGSFEEGCSKFDDQCESDEKPAHETKFSKGFWIGQTEVTTAAYRRFAEATNRRLPPDATFGNQNLNSGWAGAQLPMVNVNWTESKSYCEWIGGDLPTEAQWEYAARAGTTDSRYAAITQAAWFGDNAGSQQLDADKLLKENEAGYLAHLSGNRNTFHPVALKAPNQYALYDMLGNVWEWTADWYSETYNGTHQSDPTGPVSGDARVLRGASWTNAARALRVSIRGRRKPETRSVDTGFRCIS